MFTRTSNGLVLAGVLSLAAASAVQATDGPLGNSGTDNGHASAAHGTDSTGGGQIPKLWRPSVADTGPGGPAHNNRQPAALPQGDGEFRVAGGRGGMTGEF